MTIELRDPDLARTYVLQSLWLARVVAPSESTIEASLRWALEITSEGESLPPVGFVSDVGYAALGNLRDFDHSSHDAAGEFDPTLLRRYEDFVVGKLYADQTFERGSDAILRYQGRDRERCLAFLVNQLRGRAGFGGVILSPGVIKSLLERNRDELMAAAWESATEPLSQELLDGVGELIEKVRNTGELLGTEDIFELEHGTALHGFGQRLALRQVLQAAELLSESLPHQKPKETRRRLQVATRIVAEDTYPIGGFSSISNKGSIESLLHSQLAYIEPDDRPDLFDVKFLRDELLFYSRDENQFFRQRRAFVFALYPDLVQARVKDAGLPWQRVILLLAMLYAAVNRLIDWLSDDALTFHFAFLQDPRLTPSRRQTPDQRAVAFGVPSSEGFSGSQKQLGDEQSLLETLFREQIDNGTVTIRETNSVELIECCREYARRSQTHCIVVGATNRSLSIDNTLLTRIRLRSAVLELACDEEPYSTSDQTGIAGWQQTLAKLLEEWV